MRITPITAALATATIATLTFAGAVHAEVATYVIDPTHTFVTFEVVHFGTSTNRGRFDKKSGTVQLDTASKTGKVELTLDTASINTGTEAFDNICKATIFLTPGNFPERSLLPINSASAAIK